MRYLVALALGLAAACSGPECNHERSGPCPDGYFCSTYYGECREIVHYDGGQTDAASDAGADAQICDAVLGGHCYRALPGASSWDDAQLSCELSGGHLVTIGNDAEQAIAWSLAMGIGPTVWIGATDEGSEAVWRWTTGEPFVSRWASTPIAQPDNAGSGQHCAHLWPEAGGLWADAACASMFPAICEID
jgi:hypothetical protein